MASTLVSEGTPKERAPTSGLLQPVPADESRCTVQAPHAESPCHLIDGGVLREDSCSRPGGHRYGAEIRFPAQPGPAESLGYGDAGGRLLALWRSPTRVDEERIQIRGDFDRLQAPGDP